MGIPIISDVLNEVGKVVSELIVDKDKRDEINLKIKELEDNANTRYHEEMMGQIDVNKVEAAHPSLFVAGWRPFIGWGCGIAFLYNAVVAPFVGTTTADIAFVQTVLMAMLGIGAMRSYEKVNGVETKTLTVPARKKEEERKVADSPKKTTNWKKI